MSKDDDRFEGDIDKLVDWLADKPEDVWFDCVDRVNWDDGGWLLLAIVDHPRCTKPLAAHIFWKADPIFFANAISKGGQRNPNDESEMIVDRILLRWREGSYRTGSIVFEGPTVGYLEFLASLAPHPDPLDIPESLFSPIDGRTPKVDPAMTPEGDVDVWTLYDAAGLACNPPPQRSDRSPLARPSRTGSEIERSQDLLREEAKASKTQMVAQPQRGLGLVLFAVSAVLAALLYWFR